MGAAGGLGLAVLAAAVLCGPGTLAGRVLSGQKVCYGAFKHSCYKLAYFQDLSRRVGFQEARQACEIDGGALLSLESEAEQQLIENMLQNLTKSGSGISDGDFWIGLWRSGDGLATSSACPDLYQWADGSMSPFRNWYTDEPSCGSEACVVMYHQPTANPGLGGPYLYQWNDDRCNMKHNFICKYAPDIFPTVPAGNPYDTSKPEDQYHIIATETVKEEQKPVQTNPHYGFQRHPGRTVAWRYNDLLTENEAKITFCSEAVL
ncbi:chondrolectin isoform X6 [Zonotrichia albicollis]|uniref:chondrolectin isoform X6 n=1 Tax=Zonotrichia albicollis TaxID=44394 RepID=UPI0006B7AA08|nr:chondrolectin isoform X6 [Zonotrichia albicollis]